MNASVAAYGLEADDYQTALTLRQSPVHSGLKRIWSKNEKMGKTQYTCSPDQTA